VQVSTCLVDAYEDYNHFGEGSFTVMSNVSKWNKFCVKLKKTATESFEMLKSMYGEECLLRTSVFEWHESFKEG
jgi:NADH:ubiquinone oxidoreductase subunit C